MYTPTTSPVKLLFPVNLNNMRGGSGYTLSHTVLYA